MKHIKKFNESIFDIFKSPLKDRLWNNKPDETRISLDEKEFAGLCDNGYVTHGSNKIPVSKDKFIDLIGGDIIEVNHNGLNFKIALKDLGMNKILDYAQNSDIYQ